MTFSGCPVANGAQKWLRVASIFDYSGPHGDSKCLRSCNILDAAKINGMVINISEVLSCLYHIYVDHKSCVCCVLLAEAITIGSIHCIFNQLHRRSTCNALWRHFYIIYPHGAWSASGELIGNLVKVPLGWRIYPRSARETFFFSNIW